jgi:ADP-ribosyl-[dinitrogen reductase] hydrolase
MFRYRHDRASRPARYRHTGDPIAGPTDPPSGTAASCDWRQCRLFFFPDEALGEKYWAKSCLTADEGAECLDDARVLARVLVRAEAGCSQGSLLSVEPERASRHQQSSTADTRTLRQRRIRHSRVRLRRRIWRRPSGAFQTTDFEAAVLRAAKLGDDADTTTTTSALFAPLRRERHSG